MKSFNVSLDWVILLPPDLHQVKKAAEDLSRYIGLLAGAVQKVDDAARNGHLKKPPAIKSAFAPQPPGPAIVLNSERRGAAQNGFTWRAGPERVEIFGESDRGLCNGIYGFLAALGISWPAPGQEKLPSPGASLELSHDSIHKPSKYAGENPAEAPLRRFIPAGKKAVNYILKKSGTFVTWAARRQYDAIVIPLAAYASTAAGRKLKQLGQFAEEYGITLEAGGRDLSALVPRGHFFLKRDFFRMEEGRRVKTHHFCPTSPGAIALIGTEGQKLFRAAEAVKVFHLWPDEGAETTWCSCPTCRAFTPQEQNRIAVNAAADVLLKVNPEAVITFFEISGEGGNIPLRKNLFRMEELPEGMIFRP